MSAEPDDGDDESTLGEWLLVAVVVFSVLVVPGIVYLRPAVPGRAGLPFFTSMLVLPLIPALLLGVTAVWALARSQ